MPVNQELEPHRKVICADVDGTVISTDLLYESLLSAIKRAPSVLFRVPFWYARGLPLLKRELAKRAQLDVSHLPLNEEVVTYLHDRAKKGDTVVLASASDQTLVQALGERLGFVAETFGTNSDKNLKGSVKADLLCQKFGEGSFEYIGDSRADFPVWKRAGGVGVVASSKEITRRVQTEYSNAKIFETGGARKSVTWLRALRVYQWLKNLLIFVPLILGHHWTSNQSWGAALLALLSFSLCASGVYILNDLLDLEADRAHHRKKSRPFAAGTLPLLHGLLAAPTLFICGVSIAFLISPSFASILFVYLIFTTAYSFRLKQVVLVDIILLAMLYTIRIIAGGVASHVVVSQWLLGVSMFMFLSLACVKRFSELLVLKERNQRETRGRGYTVDDLEQIAMFGAASGYIAVLVLALYTSSYDVVQLYKNPQVIWLVCPLVLYWISRVWLLARRGKVHDDPLVFAMKDKTTYVVGVLVAVIMAAAKW
jgi:4-hydroxybenzoate polyprenyltransferase/phosphoserine phosphatase